MIGKITKLNAYKSGKGYFIGINGKDHMFYGKPDVQVGDEVEYEMGKPSADGKPTIKTIKPTPIEAYIDKPYRAHDQPQRQVKKDQKRMENEQNVRLKCLASACDFAGHGSETTMEDVLNMAVKFERYVKGGK